MPKRIITEEQLKLIFTLLKQGELPTNEAIANKINELTGLHLDHKTISDINIGKRLHQENLEYPVNKKYARRILTKCCICGEPAFCTFSKDGKQYCKKHYMQMYHNGKTVPETIFDPNQYEIKDGYVEIILKNINFKEVARTLIDLEDLKKVIKYKWYCWDHDGKKYCQGTLENGRKIRLHRYVLNLKDVKTDLVVDHINGNSLDNRKSNLRIVTQQENMRNMKPNEKTKGIREYQLVDGTKRYSARITVNYKTISLGTYDTPEEAIAARKAGEEKYWSKK
jgi:hypothetical protein